MQCVRCGSGATWRDGGTRLGGQRWRCRTCRRRFSARSASAFSRRAVPDAVIALAGRCYARFRLSYADVAEMLAERGVLVDRSTVSRWVQRLLPLVGYAARRHRCPIGHRWRVDETYCAFRGRRAAIDRAIGREGQVVDAHLSERRNAAAAPAFFKRAMAEARVTPERVASDKATCYPAARRAVLPGVEHRRSKCRNDGLERDHGHPKQRRYPMRGFKRGTSAETVVRGPALIRNLRQGFSALTAAVPLCLRPGTAWQLLAQAS